MFKDLLIISLFCIFGALGLFATIYYIKALVARNNEEDLPEEKRNAKVIIDFLASIYESCKEQSHLFMLHNIVLRLGKKYEINVQAAEMTFAVINEHLMKKMLGKGTELEEAVGSEKIIKDIAKDVGVKRKVSIYPKLDVICPSCNDRFTLQYKNGVYSVLTNCCCGKSKELKENQVFDGFDIIDIDPTFKVN